MEALSRVFFWSKFFNDSSKDIFYPFRFLVLIRFFDLQFFCRFSQVHFIAIHQYDLLPAGKHYRYLTSNARVFRIENKFFVFSRRAQGNDIFLCTFCPIHIVPSFYLLLFLAPKWDKNLIIVRTTHFFKYSDHFFKFLIAILIFIIWISFVFDPLQKKNSHP